MDLTIHNLGGSLISKRVISAPVKHENMQSLDKNRLENTLVWSAIRSKTLGTCERKYYYNYIGSWEGWNASSPPEVQAAYRVKHLTTAELQIGQLIHDQIRSILERARQGQTIHPAKEIGAVQGRFQTFLRVSEKRRLQDCSAKRPKLLVHEMGETLGAKELDALNDKIAKYLNGFFGFDDVKHLLADPAVLIPEFLDPPGFEIGHELGVPARPKTDAVFLTVDKVIICDWKCGSPSEEHRAQGLTYDLYVREKLALSPNEVTEIRFYYLGSGEVVSFVFTEEERAERLWAIGEEFETLKSFSVDPEINVAPESRFHPRVSLRCYGCNHRLMCHSFIASPLNIEGIK